MNNRPFICIHNKSLDILRRASSAVKTLLHSILTFIKVTLLSTPQHSHLLLYRLLLIFVLIVSITMSVLLWTEAIGPGVPLERSLVKNVSIEGFDDWKESSSLEEPVQDTNIPGEDTIRPNPTLRLESELSVEAPQGFFQQTEVRVNPKAMATLAWRVSDSFREDAGDCRLPETIVMTVRFVGLEEETEPLGAFQTVFALVKVPVDKENFIPVSMPSLGRIVTMTWESFQIANCHLLRAKGSAFGYAGHTTYFYSTGSNNDTKPVFHDDQVIVGYDVVREDSPGGVPWGYPTGQGSERGEDLGVREDSPGGSSWGYSGGQCCERSEDLGEGWWNWPDLLSPTHIEATAIPLVLVVSDNEEFFYAYFPVEQMPEPFSEPLRFTIPAGISQVSLVYTAQATYTEFIYEAQEQGPSLGVFLPYLERTSFEWQKTAFALAVLFLGITVFLQLVKTYLTGTL